MFDKLVETLKGLFGGGGGQEAPTIPEEPIVTNAPETTPSEHNEPVVAVPNDQSGDVNAGATGGDINN